MSELLTLSQVKNLFPERDENSNKSDFGNIALIGGCVKYSGAIRLAEMANAAMRSGAGVCTLAVPSSISKEIIPNILESTIYPLSDNEGFIEFHETEFRELAEKNSVIAFGMGIGNTEETRKALVYLLKNYEGILIVDADGINAMAKIGKKTLCNHKCKLILTPHPKEFSRLAKREVKDVLEDPEGSASKLANFLKAIVLLKGHVTTVSDGETVYRVDKGCAGMATAGSGDVLSGILAAVVANNKDDLLTATAGAAYINGLAGEFASKEVGEVSQLASDTAKAVPTVLNMLIRKKAIEPSANEIKFDGVAEEGVTLIDKTKTVVKTKFEENKSWLKTSLAIICAVVLIGIGFCIGNPVVNDAPAIEEIDPLNRDGDYVLEMKFLTKDIYIDGQLVNNYELYRPITSVSDVIYVPLSEEMCAALGLRAQWEGRHPSDLFITKAEASHAGAFYSKDGWNLKAVTGWAKANVTIHLRDEEHDETLTPAASGVVSFNDGEVLYVPLEFLENSESFTISTYRDEIGGLYISTDKDINASSYKNENNIGFITARAKYIQGFQPSLSDADCQYYEYIFRHESKVNGVDEDLLLSIARTESKFNKYSVSGSGALGIMQIMPNTALYSGLPLENLFMVHESVQFGASYISGAITTNKGDLTRALSVYNFGGGAVLSGQYDTYYANTVLSRMKDMQNQFTQQGYSNKFLTVIECTK